MCPGNHPHFPDTVQKALILNHNKTLQTTNSTKTYDFMGNIELKSVTKVNGNVVFSDKQTAFNRVLFLEITWNEITLYDIKDIKILDKLNSDVKQGIINHNLSKLVRDNAIKGEVLLRP